MDVLDTLLITFVNGLLTIGIVVVDQAAVLIAAFIALVFTRWELSFNTELSRGIGADEEIL